MKNIKYFIFFIIISLSILIFITAIYFKLKADGRKVPDELKPVKYVGTYKKNALGYPTIKIVTKSEKVIYFEPMNSKETQKADIIFITQWHRDHVNRSVVLKLKKDETILIIPENLKNKFINDFKEGSTLIIVKPNEEYDVSGIKFKTIPAYNIINERKQWNPKIMNFVGYIINFDGLQYYISGESDVIPEMKGIDVDVTFIIIDSLTGINYMHPDEAAGLINNIIKTKIVIPYHSIHQNSEKEFIKLMRGKKTKVITYLEDKIQTIIN